MPNRATHRTLGVAAGGLATACKVVSRRATDAPDDPTLDVLEIGGGMIGGALGGALPDRLEPAHTPRHRGNAHSVAAAVLIVGSARELDPWEDGCRAAARDLMEASEQALRSAEKSEGVQWVLDLASGILFGVGGILAGLAAGVPRGAVAGYLSHVGADATTPAGIPLLGPPLEPTA